MNSLKLMDVVEKKSSVKSQEKRLDLGVKGKRPRHGMMACGGGYCLSVNAISIQIITFPFLLSPSVNY